MKKFLISGSPTVKGTYANKDEVEEFLNTMKHGDTVRYSKTNVIYAICIKDKIFINSSGNPLAIKFSDNGELLIDHNLVNVYSTDQ